MLLFSGLKKIVPGLLGITSLYETKSMIKKKNKDREEESTEED